MTRNTVIHQGFQSLHPPKQAAGAVVAHHGALEHGFLLPAHEVAHEGADGGVLVEGVVFEGGGGAFEELDALGLGVAAYALDGEGVVGWVEDAIARVGVRCEKAGWGEVMEVAEGSWVSYWLMICAINFRPRVEDLLFAHREDVFSRKKILCSRAGCTFSSSP